jgi:hypothetical protein
MGGNVRKGTGGFRKDNKWGMGAEREVKGVDVGKKGVGAGWNLKVGGFFDCECGAWAQHVGKGEGWVLGAGLVFSSVEREGRGWLWVAFAKTVTFGWGRGARLNARESWIRLGVDNV